MKRFLCMLLCITTVVTSCLFVNAEVSAINDNYYILTESCPKEVIEYTETLLSTFPTNNYPIGTRVNLGEPFILKNNMSNTTLYYFPVIINGEIEYTYRIFDYNGLKYVLSESLVDELNEIGKETSKAEPAVIYLNNNEEIVIQNKSTYKIFGDESSRNFGDTTISLFSDTEEVLTYAEALNLKNDENSVEVASYNSIISSAAISSQEATYNNLRSSQRPYQACYRTPTVFETQGGRPWCAAYVTAAIVSYATGNKYYAEDIANYAGADTDETISRSKCVKFAKSKGLSQTRETVFNVSDEGMMNQIWNGGLVYVDSRKEGSLTQRHAFIVSGYCWSGTEIVNWMVRNPWYNYYEYISSDRVYSTSNGYVFKAWGNFIIDFKE